MDLRKIFSTKDRKLDKNISHAEMIIKGYGGVLSKSDISGYGVPLSSLPYPKNEIKQAIQLLLWEFGDKDDCIRDGLIQGYVLLAQFILDSDVDTLTKGYAVLQDKNIDHDGLKYIEKSRGIINNIKLDIETLMQEICIYTKKS